MFYFGRDKTAIVSENLPKNMPSNFRINIAICKKVRTVLWVLIYFLNYIKASIIYTDKHIFI